MLAWLALLTIGCLIFVKVLTHIDPCYRIAYENHEAIGRRFCLFLPGYVTAMKYDVDYLLFTWRKRYLFGPVRPL